MFAERQRVPLPAEIQSQEMFLTRFRRARVLLNHEHRVQFLQQLLVRQTVEVFQHAVVGQNLHLVVRKDHGEKPACVRIAALRLIHARRRRAAMMPVRDVERRHRREFPLDRLDTVRVANDPGRVPHAVGGGEIHIRHFLQTAVHKRINAYRRAVREEHRPRLRRQRLDVAHAVVLLVHARQLVLLDGAGEIFFTARHGHDADLRMRAHHLPVEIKTRRAILPQCALRDELLQIFFPARIHWRGVEIGAGRQINLGFADVQEAERIAGGHLPRLFRGHHVIGQFANLRRQLGLRPQRGERLNLRHKSGRGKYGGRTGEARTILAPSAPGRIRP